MKDQNVTAGPKFICIKENGKTQTNFKEIPLNSSPQGAVVKTKQFLGPCNMK